MKSKNINGCSVGLVKPQLLSFNNNLKLSCGHTLNQFELKVECYGQLNKDKSNAILICPALTTDYHAAGYHGSADKKAGWWDDFIGPYKAIDSNKFFIVSLNNLGGCAGSSGPLTINPSTKQEYGADFPLVTVKDWVASQAMLADKFAIKKWAAVIGGSLGGMQALQWAIDYPQRLGAALIIASAPRVSAQNIAFNEIARQAIIRDPNFCNGIYRKHATAPTNGLALARMVGHITYLSDEKMHSKFGRNLKQSKLNFNYEIDFQVESYLRYKGKAFSNRFDANSYLLMTKALDYFDPASEFSGSLQKALTSCICKFLIISFSSDWRFPPACSREMVDALIANKKQVNYLNIIASQGHDAFLFPIERYQRALGTYLNNLL